MQFIICGNGIVGLSTAFELLSKIGPEDRITIIGPEARAGSATNAAAAMLNSFAEIEAGSLEKEVDLFRFELSHTATRMWPEFEESLIEAAGNNLPAACSNCQGCAGGGCFGTGTYILNNAGTDRLEDENFDAIVAALQDFNEPFDWVAPSEIPNYDPHPQYRALKAVLIHNEGWFNPKIVLEKLSNLLRANARVKFIDAEIASLTADGDRISRVNLVGGEVVEGDEFLLTIGASFTKLMSASELDLPIQRVFYGVGVSLEIKAPQSPATHCVRTPNRGLACGLYTVPYYQGPSSSNDHILIGSSNFISADPYPSGRLSSVSHLLEGAIRQVNRNFDRADFVRCNVGWRPTSQDGYPMIGGCDFVNLNICTGTKRDGFHMAPLLADTLACLATGESVDPRLNVFSPQRKLINSMSRENAIDLAVKHKINAAYQHGFEPSYSRMHDEIASNYRADLNKLHDEVGAQSWGIPPEMIDMYRYGHARPSF